VVESSECGNAGNVACFRPGQAKDLSAPLSNF